MNQLELQAYANLDKLTYPNRIHQIPNETPVLVNVDQGSFAVNWKRGTVKRCKYNSYGTCVNDYWVNIEDGWSTWFPPGKVCVDRALVCLITDKPGDLEFEGNAFNKNLYQAYRDRIKELGIEPEDQYIAGFSRKPEGLEVVLLEDPRGTYYGHATLYIYKQRACELTILGCEWQGVFNIGSIRSDISTGTTYLVNSSQEQIIESLDRKIDWLIEKGWVIKRQTPRNQ